MRKSSLLLVSAFCLAMVLLSFETVQTSADPGSSWCKTYGSDNWDVAYSVIQTSDGGYVIAGYTSSYGAGANDFWLVKTDSSGNEEWSKTFGGTNEDKAYSVIQTSDGGYAIAGSTYSYSLGVEQDLLLVKTDSSGDEEWSRTLTDIFDLGYARSVIQTSDGGYALAGTIYPSPVLPQVTFPPAPKIPSGGG